MTFHCPSKDGDLSARPGKPSVEVQQPQPRLLRRGCAAVDKREQFEQLPHAPRTLVPPGQLEHLVIEIGRRPLERIQPHECLGPRKVPAEVVGGPSRRRDRNALAGGDLVVVKAFGAGDDPFGWPGVAPDELDRRVGVNPGRTVQRRRGDPCDHAFTAGSQPSSVDDVHQVRRISLGHIDIPVHSYVSAPQLVLGHSTGSLGLAADDELPHGRILAADPDKLGEAAVTATNREWACRYLQAHHATEADVRGRGVLRLG